MEIGNSKILKGLSKVFNKHKVGDSVQEQSVQVKIGSKPELPDIRSSNIVLPNKKYYIHQTTTAAVPPQPKADPKPIEEEPFVAPQISETVKQIRTPQQYEPATVIRPQTENAKKIYQGTNVAQYKNTETGDMVIRILKNDMDFGHNIKSDEVTEILTHKPNEALKYVKDYEHNAESEMIIDNPLEPLKTSVSYKKTVYKDADGNVLKTEEARKSPYLQGVYDITETDAAGNVKNVCKTTKYDDGSISLEKNLVSIDGTTTTYNYHTDADGNHKKMSCEIKDKDGNVLSKLDRTFDKVNENTTYSSVNGIKYKTEKKGKGLVITNEKTGETTKISAFDYNAPDSLKADLKRTKPDIEYTNENIVNTLFDNMPADEILKMNKNVNGVISVKDPLFSAFSYSPKVLFCSSDSQFILNHELGHAQDTKDNKVKNEYGIETKLSENSEFIKNYDEERTAFMKAFPQFEEDFIDYFLHSSQAIVLLNQGSGSNPSSQVESNLREVVAETNAINGLDPEEPDAMGMRTVMLQRYFPKTIATLTNFMHPQA